MESSRSDQNSQETSWNRLCRSLELLQTVTTSRFPLLTLAIETLLSCQNPVMIRIQNRPEFEDQTTKLTTLSQSLTRYLGQISPVLESDCATRTTMSIESRARSMKVILDRAPEVELPEADSDKEELLKHYRQIHQLFQKFLNLGEYKNDHMESDKRALGGKTPSAHKLLIDRLLTVLQNTRLDTLHPVKQAAFDSSLSTEVNRRGCTEGTRIGVLAGLDDWLHDLTSPSIYWMNGMAGTGKTTIASTFCERTKRRKILAASFFCTRSSAECRNVSRIVPTIAYQLARYSMPYQSTLCEALERDSDIGTQGLSKQFEQLLRKPLEQVKNTLPDDLVVVIDGLDECDNRGAVELMLDVLFRYASQVPLKFLLTSRPEPEIYSKMSLYSQSREFLHLHDLESSLVRADIELYLTRELAFISPDQVDVQELAHRSSILFIYAATLVRYINPGKKSVDPQKRLQSLLSMDPSATKQHTHIDALYTAVLNSALNEDHLDTEVVESANVVLRTVLAAQEPIGVETITKLSQIENSHRVELALHLLGSVLHRSEATGLVSTLHASFPDFIFSEKRSGPYFCDIAKHSELIALGCFQVMKYQLRFNICDLESSLAPDHQVTDMQERISQKISPALFYACRYWGSHLGLALNSDILSEMLDTFLRDQLLFWMEVLSVKREVVMGIEILITASYWLNHAGPVSPSLRVLLEDARNFVTSFAGSPASQSTPHIYISSLPFCPRSSSVYENYWKRTRGLIKLDGTLMDLREGAAISSWNIGSEVWSVAYSPDGTRVAVGCEDRTIRMLNAHDGTPCIDPLQGHTGPVQSVAFSPDGKLVASGSSDRSIRLWNTYNGNISGGPFKGHTAFVYAVAFSSDGTRIVSGSMDRTVRVWNTFDGTLLLGPLEGHSNIIESVTFSPDDGIIASASYDHTIRLWNSHDGSPATPRLKGHTDYVKSIAFTPDGTRLISGSYDKTIRVWDVSDGSPVGNPFEENTSGIQRVVVSHDGTKIAYGLWDATVRVCNIDDGNLVAGPFVGHTADVTSIAYSPDGTRLISASSDGTIRVWNVRGRLGSPHIPFRNHVTDISSVSLSSSSRIVSFDRCCGMWIWDLTEDGVVRSPMNGRLTSPALRPPLPFSTGPKIIVRAEDGSIYVMNMADSSFLAGPLYGHTGSLTSFGFATDGTSFATGSDDGTICVWQPPKSTPIAGPFRAHNGTVTSVALSLDCCRVVSCSEKDKTIRVWNTRNSVARAISPTESSSLPSTLNLPTFILRGWKQEDDGWATDGNSGLLLWMPPDTTRVSLFPNVEFIITEDGILHVTNWELLLGDRWSECYMSG